MVLAENEGIEMKARLICPTRSLTFNLVSNDNIVSTGHSKHDFAASGKKADGTRFDVAADLGITRLSFNEFDVADLDAFIVWDKELKNKVSKPIASTPAYDALQNEGYIEPEFIDRTPAHPLDY